MRNVYIWKTKQKTKIFDSCVQCAEERFGAAFHRFIHFGCFIGTNLEHRSGTWCPMKMEFVMRGTASWCIYASVSYVGKNILCFSFQTRWHVRNNGTNAATLICMDRFDNVGKNGTSAAFYLTLDERLPSSCSSFYCLLCVRMILSPQTFVSIPTNSWYNSKHLASLPPMQALQCFAEFVEWNSLTYNVDCTYSKFH